MTIQLKRIYEPDDARDGVRVLVDRPWARGMSKAAVAAVAPAQPSGEAFMSNLRPFLAVLPLVPEPEAALQALRDRGAVQEGHDGWRLTARGERLLRDDPTGPADQTEGCESYCVGLSFPLARGRTQRRDQT